MIPRAMPYVLEAARVIKHVHLNMFVQSKALLMFS
jgi:hypothetical protein